MSEEKQNQEAVDNDKATKPAQARTLWGDAWKRLKKNKLAMVAIVWIVFIVLVALTADLWAPQWLGDPTAADSTTMTANSRLAPSPEHPFGTDTLGRDVLCRVIYGARVSLAVGLLATAISTAIGLVMGAIAAYYGGIWDTIVMRLADIFMAFPYTLFVIAMIAVLGNGIQNVFIAIGLFGVALDRACLPLGDPVGQGERLRRRGSCDGRL